MKVDVEAGKYVLAVSGGVDSMALLNMLSKLPEVELVVAHFNHGIRADADEDETLAMAAAKNYGWPFESAKGGLGLHTSEETARNARYIFLEIVRNRYRADSIITAHHQDDLVETAFINLLRGTGRRGLVSMAANPKVLRPLLDWTKKDILRYARQQGLEWREDSSNQDEEFLRNYIRRCVMTRLSVSQRRSIIKNLDDLTALETAINPQIEELSQIILKDGLIDRSSFTSLPVDLGRELVLFWLRQQRVRQPDKKTVKRLNVALRASKGGTKHPVAAGLDLLVGNDSARFSHSL